jgi:2-isopropylmalate synthase
MEIDKNEKKQFGKNYEKENKQKIKNQNVKKKIKIFDTTLRDGEQSPGAKMCVEEKIRIAKQLTKLGVDIIEAGFPIASKEDFNAVKEIAKKVKGPIITGLARAKQEDIDAAWKAIKYSKKPRIHVFMSTSNIHLENQFKISKNEALKMSVNAVKYAKQYCDDIEFSPMDATRTETKFLYKVIKNVIDAGATTINIADTVGFSQPEEFGKMIKNIFRNVPNIKNAEISVHCHNDLGLAVANSMAAIKEGATQIECTVNGIGERAGNAALEEIVTIINTRNDYYPFITNINTKEIIKSSKLVSEATNIFVQKNKAIVGANAFSHESGIHQQGIISNTKCYEIINAKNVGTKTTFFIGRHSGKHAIKDFLKKNKIKTNNETIQQAMEIVKNIKNENAETAIITNFRRQ